MSRQTHKRAAHVTYNYIQDWWVKLCGVSDLCAGVADFLDSWKISGNDPVWQSLDLKGSSSGVPFCLKADDSTTFGF